MAEEHYRRETLPVNLLLAQRLVLVVGGGSVAARKVQHVLEAGARVRVVAPTLGTALQELVASGRVDHLAKTFEAEDLTGVALAFATTDSGAVNRAVLTAARQRGIWVSAADQHWVDGDFVTPAILRHEDLVLGISTGGRSCRRSRMIKDSLARHLATTEHARLLVMGTGHQQLDLARREAFHLSGDRLTTAGRLLMHVWGVHEFLLLNTCNRVELIALVGPDEATLDLCRRILELDHLGGDDYYCKVDRAAFDHLALLAAGLLSQAQLEEHIVGQLRDALAVARFQGWAGGLVEEWVTVAIRIAKSLRLRARGVLTPDGEIEDLAVRHLLRQLPAGSTVAVLGTGTIGTGLVTRLAGQFACDWVYHRQAPVQRSPAAVTIHPWSDLPQVLAQADAVVAATSGQALGLEAAAWLPSGRKLLILDLGLPRSVEARLAGPTVTVLDLDGLKTRQEPASGSGARRQAWLAEHEGDYRAFIHRCEGRNASAGGHVP